MLYDFTLNERNKTMAKKIFISFAIEDVRCRDLLRGQSLNIKSPYGFTDMSATKAWTKKWKTNCRARIKRCDGVIALISKKTRNADGAKWEMQCAKEEGIPIIGIHVHKDDKGQVPSQLAGKMVVNWTWSAIENFINRV